MFVLTKFLFKITVHDLGKSGYKGQGQIFQKRNFKINLKIIFIFNYTEI